MKKLLGPRRLLQSGLCLAVAVSLAAWVPQGAANADTAPPPGSPSTVSADGLPTWQVNGVVWAQVLVGNTVYATGNFSQARPPGVSVGGPGSVSAQNIFAYDIRTGNRVTSFNHSLNAQGLAITASPDGSKVYVAGDFTTVDGNARGHVAAFNTTNNALNTSFAPNVSSVVKAVAASNDTVWIGGNFFRAGTSNRRRLAAFNANNGAVLPWAPTADDDQVASMVLAPGGDRVIIGGKFSTLNTVSARGMGSVDAVSGASRPWAANQVMNNSGRGSSITSLSTDGTQIYGTGYAFETGNFEGTFGADPTTGEVAFLNNCHGDTYDAEPIDGVLYSVSHAHDCSWIRSFPEVSPRRWMHALAFSTSPSNQTNIGPDNYGWNYAGVATSTLLQWFPDLDIGGFTGQNQAAWSVTGNSDYVTMGGEFPRVNGAGQQGLTRFAKASTAPNARGPVRAPNAPDPTAQSFSGSSARVAWQAAFDMDNANLTYEVYRSGTAEPVYTVDQESNFWTYPQMGFTDRNLTPGATFNYRVKVIDPFGNSIFLPRTGDVTVVSGASSVYADGVVADGASAYWRMGESSGDTMFDYAGFNDATARSGVGRGAVGAINGDSNRASTFDGTGNGFAVSRLMSPTANYTVEGWVKTSSTSGGKIVGYGNSSLGSSSSYDRHLYMTNDGRIVFGVYTGTTRTLSSGAGLNDNAWHHVVATQDAQLGTEMYIDGIKVGADPSVTNAQDYSGYWRIGGDNLNGWPNRPSSDYLAGAIDDVAIYPSAIGQSRVQQHYEDSGRSLGLPPVPTDTYGSAVYESSPDFFWRLGEATGTTAVDSSRRLGDGTYSGGVTLGANGAVGGSNTAVQFDGSSAGVAANASITNPTRYSEELWFKTTTTTGGKLIGFGSNQTGLSNNYDRHVYMENSGQLTFGVWTGQTNTITSSAAFNDGEWHHMVATQGTNGMALFVDGASVGTNPQNQAQSYTGFWRVGGDTTWSGDSNYFNGTIDEVAVYSRAISSETVAAHYQAGGGQVANVDPSAGFTSNADGLKVSFDASSSTDADGTIDSYVWDFGDGETGAGVAPDHTYDTDGTYTVRLTVTDDRGGSNSVENDVTVINQAPTARFEASSDLLDVAVDASASSDPDGTVEAYVWNWGDGTPASTGVTADHSYASAGSYLVTLTVTDDKGKSATTSQDVLASSNQSPTAAFTSSTTGLQVDVNGTGSSDPDGTVESHTWSWGDATPDGSGSTTTHAYAAAGTYSVKLTVSDNRGGTDSITQDVTVTAPPVQTELARDGFARNVSNGWGNADLGGSWSRLGSASNFSTGLGFGNITMPTAGSGPRINLYDVSSSDTEVSVSVGTDKASTGSGIFLTVRPRVISAEEGYWATARIMSDGRVYLTLNRRVGNSNVALAAGFVNGLNVTQADRVRIKAQAFGTSPTTFRAKVWKVGDVEPAGWNSSVIDSTPALQAPGGVGLGTYLSGSSTNAPVVASFSDFVAGPTP